MKDKINVAKLLNNCPRGMELDCTMYDNCTFDGLEDVGYVSILVKTPNGRIKLTKNGCYVWGDKYAKCIIFPKGKSTWEGFQIPFKDGDVVVVECCNCYQYIVFHTNAKDYISTGYNCLRDTLFVNNKVCEIEEITSIRKATEEEKQKLLDAIKSQGYKWNAETKTLEKLIEPKFKVGDKIENSMYRFTIAEVKDKHYLTKCGNKIPFDNQDDFSLVPDKFDITTLKPFDKVLVAYQKGEWHIQFFEKYSPTSKLPFICIGGSAYQQCVPYEENSHLMNTTNDCDEFYKTWE